MRGSVIRRSKTSWALVVDIGRDEHGKRRQRWRRFEVDPTKTVKENRQLAQQKLTELLHQKNTNTYVDASKMTLAQYLTEWHTKISPLRDPETARVYGSMIKHVAAAPIGMKLLQKVTASDLEHFYATVTPRKGKKQHLAPGTVQLIHAVVGEALGAASRDHLIAFSPAKDAKERPKRTRQDAQHGARENCWSGEDARKVLAAAKAAGPQIHAFFALALDTGGRKSELLGLTWANVDLDKAEITIAHQLVPRAATRAEFKPTKTRKIRTVAIDAETAAILRTHRKQQRELLMANRKVYQNFDLVFAKEHQDLQTPKAQLGEPCYALVESHFRRVLKAAGVKRIGVHGLRHTTATLLLADGEQVKTVADRLGHEKPSMTLDVYTHAVPGAQQGAAARVGNVLFGR